MKHTIYFGEKAVNDYMALEKMNIVKAVFFNDKNMSNLKMLKTIYSGAISNVEYIEVNGQMLNLQEFAEGPVTFDFPEDGTPVNVSYKFVASVTNLDNAFKDCEMKSIDMTKLDMSMVESAASLFANNTLNGIDIHGMNLEHVANVSGLFEGCPNMVELPDVITPSATNMDRMFKDCVKVHPVADLNMSKCISAVDMFKNCPALKDIEISYAPAVDVKLDLTTVGEGGVMSLNTLNGGNIQALAKSAPASWTVQDQTGEPLVFDDVNVVKAVF